MSLLLKQLVRYAARQVAANPQAREKAFDAAQFVAAEAKQIANDEDRARAAGRSVRRVLNRLLDGAPTQDKT